ncbi:hypothetical protein [Corynebacterium sp. NML130628]|uniref:hypothetical protein n=1 Tax=Corynebacterium sp. NML130628 TaxID=1906333 RepID=UPI0008FB6FF7|nr:hypothetical protein [Corynebacterium sp. NML130628]OIR45852.1 hypothetical protein BJP07_02145 [Corynebacterium sp. NML130628]
MKRLLVAGAALGLAACAPAPPVWQVVAVYTSPDTPGDLPDRANVSIDGSKLTGSTGCGKVEGEVTVTEDTLAIHEISFPDPAGCEGAARYTHDQLASVVVPEATFHINNVSDTEKVLTLDGEDVNEPSVRVMML